MYQKEIYEECRQCGASDIKIDENQNICCAYCGSLKQFVESKKAKWKPDDNWLGTRTRL